MTTTSVPGLLLPSLSWVPKAHGQDAGATEFCFDIAPETTQNALDTLDRFANEVRAKL